MLHLRPDLVRMDKAQDFRSTQLDFIDEFKHLRAHGPIQFGWKAQDLNPHGAVGNASSRPPRRARRSSTFRPPPSSNSAATLTLRDGAAVEALTGTAPTALRRELGGIATADDPATLKLKSRDFFWFSPILKPLLDDKRADLVVAPRNKDDVLRVAAACARHRVPLTVRGGGTGNYGQAVPLAGGFILDMSGLDRVVRSWARRGSFRGRGEAPRYRQGAAAGALGAALPPVDPQAGDDRRLHRRRRGRLRLLHLGPDRRSRRGHRRRGRDRRGAPRLIELEGRDILKVLHAYGVNGIITEVEVPLAPWQPWAERIAAFPTLGARRASASRWPPPRASPRRRSASSTGASRRC